IPCRAFGPARIADFDRDRWLTHAGASRQARAPPWANYWLTAGSSSALHAAADFARTGKSVRFSPHVASFSPLEAQKSGARKRDFHEPIQADLGRPVPPRKNISLSENQKSWFASSIPPR